MNKSAKIRKLRLSDAAFSASIHINTMPGVSSALGESYLKNFYKVLINNHKDIAIGAEINRHLIGLVTATEDVSETSRQMHKLMTLATYMTILKKTFTLKISLPTILSRINFEKHQSKSYLKPYFSIVTFCVDNSYQHQGIGALLMGEILYLAKKKGLRYVYVDTRESNDRAIRFYKKFQFIEETRISGNIIFRRKLQFSG